MSTRHLVDPELLPFLDAFPVFEFNAENLPAIRKFIEGLGALNDPAPFGVTRAEIVLRQTGASCLVYTPAALASPSAALLYFHGGGLVVGTAAGSDLQNLRTAQALGIVVVSVDYSLAPERPFPAAVHEGYEALAWMFEDAAALNIDPTRIAVGGDSAGGGLAASLALYARDKSEYEIAFQHLIYPMLNDRTLTAAANCGEYIWTAQDNTYGWAAYLSGQNPAACYVPSRAKDFAGLPLAWIGVGSLDLFIDENIEFVRKIHGAGGTAELQIYPGAFHGFPMAEGTKLAVRFWRDYYEALARGLNISL